ncbi:MAG: hypothetical protein IKZ53_08040 [Selenomonadaceae bacterium]|nr:hypothetical protein [Selenomonadaceae bacterium]
MTEKGFATIFGLCLILAITLVVKGIEESGMNDTYETADFQTEFELQNLADSGIYKAVDKKDSLSYNRRYPPLGNSRPEGQFKVISEKITSDNRGLIELEVWGERMIIKRYTVDYANKKNNKHVANIFAEDKTVDKEVYVFFSCAKMKSKRMDGKIYRRAFAYVESDGDGTIHFMELPSEEYYYKK